MKRRVMENIWQNNRCEQAVFNPAFPFSLTIIDLLWSAGALAGTIDSTTNHSMSCLDTAELHTRVKTWQVVFHSCLSTSTLN